MTKEEFVESLVGIPKEKHEDLIKLFDESEKNHSLKIEAFTDRDTYKQKSKALENEKNEIQQKIIDIEREKAEKEGEFKTLYETTLEENKTLKEKAEKVDEYETKLAEAEQERRTELIERLPDGEFREVAETIVDRKALKKYVDNILKITEKKIIPDGRKSGEGFMLDGRTWKQLTIAEKEELRVSDPKKYEELKLNRNN